MCRKTKLTTLFLPHLNDIYALVRGQGQGQSHPIIPFLWTQMQTLLFSNGIRSPLAFKPATTIEFVFSFVLFWFNSFDSCSSFINFEFILYQLRVHPSSTSCSSFINFVFILHQHRDHRLSTSCSSFINIVFILHQLRVCPSPTSCSSFINPCRR